MLITTPNKTILYSSTVITDDDNPITFTLAPDFIFTIKFENKDNVDPVWLSNLIAPGHLEFTCVNFNETLGRGSKYPLSMGTIEGHDIFMNLWIYKLGQETPQKKIEITFYKQVRNGN